MSWAVFIVRSLPWTPYVIMIQLWRGKVFTEDIPAYEPGEVFLDLEGHESSFGNGEYEIEVFEGTTFGFLNEEKDEDEGDDVETGEETKRAPVTETRFVVADGRIKHGEEASEEEIDRDGPGGADFSVGEGEAFGSQGERDRAESWRVGDGEH